MESHVIMESLVGYVFSRMEDGTKVHHFFLGIKSTEFGAAVNVFWSQQEEYGKHFDKTVSYLGQMVSKTGYTMQPIHIAKTRSQSAKPKVTAFMGKIECKK